MRILLRNPIAFIAGNLRFLSIAREFRPTHVHAFNQFFILSFLPALLITKIPLVYNCGDKPTQQRLIWRLLWRFAVWHTYRFVAVSRFIAIQLRAADVPERKITVIYAGPPVRDRHVAPLALPHIGRKTRNIVFVGQIVEGKGVHLLVEAFRTLAPRYPEAQLLVAGRISDWDGGRWARDLRDTVAHDALLSSRIDFLGYVEDIPALLRQCEVLVAPSLIEEAFGLVVMEAKMAGLPSIVFPSGGLPEMIDAGVDGYVCEEKTAKSLANALTIYLDNLGLAAQHGVVAKASLERFKLAEFARRWYAVYEGNDE